MKFIPSYFARYHKSAGNARHRLELTRRNLTVLLAKLDMPGSARTLVDPDGMIEVVAVEDSAHYADRAPGPMLVHGQVE